MDLGTARARADAAAAAASAAADEAHGDDRGGAAAAEAAAMAGVARDLCADVRRTFENAMRCVASPTMKKRRKRENRRVRAPVPLGRLSRRVRPTHGGGGSPAARPSSLDATRHPCRGTGLAGRGNLSRRTNSLWMATCVTELRLPARRATTRRSTRRITLHYICLTLH